MSDAVIFILVFAGLFVLRIIFATLVFFWILPQTDRCLDCDAVTLRLEPTGFRRLFPWFRYSWCLRCGWRGVLRGGGESGTPAADGSPPGDRARKPSVGSRVP